MDPQSLLIRLDEIGKSLERSDHALALIGLGSVGMERERLDAYSDLDFFVVVEPGYKQAYLDSLHWLNDIQPVAYSFLNTEDGYKLLFEDRIFCEFAVFEPAELEHIPFAAGRFVWRRDSAPEAWLQPAVPPAPRARRSPEWLLGEALTNLYVGLNREKRGEKFSAARFIQGYTVDRLVELIEHLETARNVSGDPFAKERRFERRFPEVVAEIGKWMQGYERNSDSAQAILAFLEKHFEVNQAMVKAIRELCV